VPKSTVKELVRVIMSFVHALHATYAEKADAMKNGLLDLYENLKRPIPRNHVQEYDFLITQFRTTLVMNSFIEEMHAFDKEHPMPKIRVMV